LSEDNITICSFLFQKGGRNVTEDRAHQVKIANSVASCRKSVVYGSAKLSMGTLQIYSLIGSS